MAPSAPNTDNTSPASGALLLWQKIALLSRAQMRRLSWLLAGLEVALTGREHLEWGPSEYRRWGRLLRRAGVVLFTKAQLKRQRHQTKPKARPVVVIYCDTPFDPVRELYILDVQTRIIHKPLHVASSTD